MTQTLLGLAPRPVPDPEISAVLSVVIDQLMNENTAVEPTPPNMAWRFSGHWFSKHQVSSRNRPA
ncbi:MAG: hypothetical protein WCG59_07760 [Actinomycetes bacterium]